MSLQTLFASEELEAVFLPGNSDVLLITFAALDFSTTTDAFWGRNFAQKAGFAAIGFVPRRNNWYPQKDMAAAAQALSDTLRRYPSRISYGSSMGAYGAVKYSALLGCSACAAFGPQFSINPADGITSLAYTRYYEPALHAAMSIKQGDVCADPYIFYDPRERFDATNALSIAAVAPQANLIRMPHTGHECIKVVAGLAQTSRLLETCLTRDAGTVRAMCRQLRRQSPARRAGLAGALVSRRPDLAFRIVDRSASTFDRKQLATFYDAAAAAYAEKGDIERAEANCLRAIDLLPDRTSFLRRLGGLYERTGRLEDALIWYTRYLELNPLDTALLNAVAGVSLALNDIDGAEIAVAKAFAMSPQNVNVIRRLGAVRRAQGRVADAVSILIRGAAAHPSNAAIHLDLSHLMSAQNKAGEALDKARQALALDPGNMAAKARIRELEHASCSHATAG